METLILEGGGINWTWYCHVNIAGETATIIREYRLHNYDDWQGAGKHPAKVHGSYRMIEDAYEWGKPRLVTAIEIQTAQGLKRYPLPNLPRFGFPQ